MHISPFLCKSGFHIIYVAHFSNTSFHQNSDFNPASAAVVLVSISGRGNAMKYGSEGDVFNSVFNGFKWDETCAPPAAAVLLV